MPLIAYQNIVPKIDPTAFVALGAQVIGDVEIGPDASVWYNCVLRGDVNIIRIGEGSNIQDGTIIHVSRKGHPAIIGAYVTVGHRALIHACRLEDSCFIGMGATVMDGAVVESGGMVAAGALIAPGKRVGRGELWAGSPAKMMRSLSAEEISGFTETAKHYVKLAHRYRDAQ